MADNLPGIAATLPKGTKVELNGLAVEFDENLHFRILDATNNDQAAEFAGIHKLACDFSHFDEEKNVFVTYAPADASRIETTPEAKAEADAKAEEAQKAAEAEAKAEAKAKKKDAEAAAPAE